MSDRGSKPSEVEALRDVTRRMDETLAQIGDQPDPFVDKAADETLRRTEWSRSSSTRR